MLNQSRFYFLFFLLSSFFLNSSELFGGQRCAEILSQISNNHEIHESKFVRAFRASPNLLLFNRAPRKAGTARAAFISSNEYDIFKIPAVLPQRELFIGIGNNASWDLALRSGARKLLLFDINYEPLMMQRYFFRTLFEISENPVEFYRYLFLVPLKDVQSLNSFKDLSEYDWHLFLKMRGAPVEQVGPFIRAKKQVIEEIFTKIKEKSQDPEKKVVLEFLKIFYREPFTHSSALFEFATNANLMEIQHSFRMRYFPNFTHAYYQMPEASFENLYQENLSFLSSMKSYHEMRQLMLGADYIQLPLHSSLWDFVAKSAKDQVDGVTVYNSNILEINKSDKDKSVLRSEFKQRLIESFLGFQKPVSYIETLGNGSEHEYDYQELVTVP
jgi:hypothetical protein